MLKKEKHGKSSHMNQDIFKRYDKVKRGQNDEKRTKRGQKEDEERKRSMTDSETDRATPSVKVRERR